MCLAVGRGGMQTVSQRVGQSRYAFWDSLNISTLHKKLCARLSSSSSIRRDAYDDDKFIPHTNRKLRCWNFIDKSLGKNWWKCNLWSASNKNSALSSRYGRKTFFTKSKNNLVTREDKAETLYDKLFSHNKPCQFINQLIAKDFRFTAWSSIKRLNRREANIEQFY